MGASRHAGRREAPEDLVRAARAGDTGAFGRLVRRFEGALFQYLRLRTRSPADAEEIAQRSFVRAWERLDAYDERWRFSTWLYTLARHEAASFHRHEARQAVPDGAPDPVDPRSDDGRGRAVETDAHGRGRLWALASRLLTHEQFDALWLRYAEDLPSHEVARVLGRPDTNVRVLLHRARRRLEKHLRTRSGGPEAVGRDAWPSPRPLARRA